MNNPKSDKSDSQEDAFSSGNGGPACNPIPKGANDALSVPGGVPESNVIPR